MKHPPETGRFCMGAFYSHVNSGGKAGGLKAASAREAPARWATFIQFLGGNSDAFRETYYFEFAGRLTQAYQATRWPAI